MGKKGIAVVALMLASLGVSSVDAQDAQVVVEPAAIENESAMDAGVPPDFGAPPAAAPIAIATPAQEEVDEEDEAQVLTDPLIAIHAFVSQGFMVSSANNFLTRSSRGSFEFTEVGINLTSQITEQLRVGAQLFSRELGSVGNYNVKADWYYLDYRFADWLGIRAGRTRLPLGLYNDTMDVDVAHNAILLPQAMYPQANRDFFLAQTGGELYGRLTLGGAGALDYRLYGGTIYIPLTNTPGSTTITSSIDVPYLLGGRVFWETPLEGLRVGVSLQRLRLDANAQIMGMPVSISLPATIWVASAEYAAGDLLLAAEYSRWRVDYESSDEMVFPNRSATSERAYVMANYRLAPFFQPGVYYSLTFPDTKNRSGRGGHQHDVALTLRFDVNEHWLIKLEGHYMNGTAGLSSELNEGVSPSLLTEQWGLFLVKTTAYF